MAFLISPQRGEGDSMQPLPNYFGHLLPLLSAGHFLCKRITHEVKICLQWIVYYVETKKLNKNASQSKRRQPMACNLFSHTPLLTIGVDFANGHFLNLCFVSWFFQFIAPVTTELRLSVHLSICVLALKHRKFQLGRNILCVSSKSVRSNLRMVAWLLAENSRECKKGSNHNTQRLCA